eukprot:1010642-Amphidinium_carterae.1
MDRKTKQQMCLLNQLRDFRRWQTTLLHTCRHIFSVKTFVPHEHNNDHAIQHPSQHACCIHSVHHSDPPEGQGWFPCELASASPASETRAQGHWGHCSMPGKRSTLDVDARP